MNDDIRRSLLTNKGTPFQKLYEECLVKIQRIKQKNDFMQRQVGGDMQDAIAEEVKRQRQFLQHQILDIKQIIDEIQNRFKDPESRNKLKNIKVQAEKQIRRNKIIMKDFITKSFMNKSRGSVDDQNDQNTYFEGGKVDYNHLDVKTEDKHSLITDRSKDNEDIQVEQQMDLDYQIQRKIVQEKSNVLKQLQQSNLRVNAIMNDMGIQVMQQGQNLDVISEQLLKAHKNVSSANQELDEASKQQKKSRKKYVILVFLIILLVAGVVGVVVVFT